MKPFSIGLRMRRLPGYSPIGNASIPYFCGREAGVAKILIAEDSEEVRTFVARALSRDGHQVDTVEDGVKALEALTEEAYDLVIADIVMPELDGISLALKVAKDQPDLPILLMTGYPAERERAHNLDALIRDVIVKPFTLKDICDAARRVLERDPVGTTH
jgi:DNA-binding response OmpR family regulator